MKSLSEYRNKILGEKMNMGLRYLNSLSIDWEVYLPTKGMNLQRSFVWNEHQKEDLIHSVFLGRTIPTFSFYIVDDSEKELIKVIDGKQRLSTLLDYFNNKFSVYFDNTPLFFRDLPKDYQVYYTGFTIPVAVIYDSERSLTDLELIEWFTYINYAGTPQDEKHILKTINLKNMNTKHAPVKICLSCKTYTFMADKCTNTYCKSSFLGVTALSNYQVADNYKIYRDAYVGMSFREKRAETMKFWKGISFEQKYEFSNAWYSERHHETLTGQEIQKIFEDYFKLKD